MFSAHKYHNRAEFLEDIELICQNCEAYNGPQSPFTQQAHRILILARESLNQVIFILYKSVLS